MSAEFSHHVAECGYRVTSPVVTDGHFHRANWKPGTGKGDASWYIGWDHDGFSVISWGDWRDDFREVWTSRGRTRLSQSERAIMKADLEKARAETEKTRKKLAEAAVRTTEWIWGNAEINPEHHPYLVKKRITGEYLRWREGRGRVELLVPLCDATSSLRNIQRIGPDGTKRFIKDAPISGLWWRSGPKPADEFGGDLAVVEGVATAETVRELSGLTTFAAITAGNLPAVVKWMREKWPASRILIGADDDRWEKDGTPRTADKNVGRKKAGEAAEGTRALVILPTWHNLTDRGTDWNDLAAAEGVEGARAKWIGAVTVATLDRQVAGMSDTEYAARRANLQAAYRNAGAGAMGSRELDRRRKESREQEGNEPSTDSRQPPLLDLMAIVADYELWHDQVGTAYCTMQNRGIWMNAQVEGQFFGDWLRAEYEDRTANAEPIIPQTLSKMTAHIAAKARTVSPQHQSFYRLGKCSNYRWLDLGRPDWKCVRWNADGWEVVDAAAVKFYRGTDSCPLPIPALNPEINGLDPLWAAINTAEENRPLLAGFILGALKSDTPCFGMNIQGEHGSAKSVATELIRSIIDYTPTPFQRLNNVKPEDLGNTCTTQLLPCFDNISHIESEMQDVMCSMTTGFGFKTRKLYTNGEVVACWVRRPWIVNSIPNVCSRSDLAERTIPLKLDVIETSTRKTEDEVRGAFTPARAHLLAVFLNAAVEAERNWESAGIAIRKSGMSHRMADAIQWITAGEDALGFVGGTFLSRMTALQQEAGAEALEGTPQFETIEALLNEIPRGEWTGTASEFLDKQKEFAEGVQLKYLPHNEKSLGDFFKRERRRLLESFGIKVSDTFQDRKYGDRKRRRSISRVVRPNFLELDEENGF